MRVNDKIDLRDFMRNLVWALVSLPQDWQWYLFCSSRVSVLKNSWMQSSRSTGRDWICVWVNMDTFY